MKRRVYISLKFKVEGLKTNRSTILFGYPTLMTYYGFLVNILLKSDLTDSFKDIEFVPAIKSFRYSVKRERTITKKMPRLIFNNKAIMETGVVFSFLTEDISNFNIKEKLSDILDNIRFSGKIIKDIKISVYNETDKKNAEKDMFGYFYLEKVKIDRSSSKENLEEDLFNLILKKGAQNEITISGYNFLSNIKDNEINQKGYERVKNKVFAEAIYSLIKFKAFSMNKIRENQIPYLKYTETDKYIKIKNKGE